MPIGEVATVEYVLDDGYVWRRNRLPTITVQADTVAGIQAPTVYQSMQDKIDALRATLPPGAFIEDGGTVEKSAQSNAAILAVMPLMVMLMLTVLMIQLDSFQRLFLLGKHRCRCPCLSGTAHARRYRRVAWTCR